MNRRWLMRAGTAAIALGYVLSGMDGLRAQYPGHISTQQKPSATATLRSVAVLEWTGDRNHPNATRLVPISLFDGERLQDGALYLARPVPLALDSGTEYEVESSGRPQGWFDIEAARQLGDDWFGFGNWKPYVPPPPKKLHPSRNPPTVVGDKSNDDKPHFVRRDQSSGTGNAGGSASQDKNGNKTQDKSEASSSPVDPDRPKLRRRASDDTPPPQQAASAPESPSSAPDPDRPRLAHGIPADLKDAPKPLELTPVAMGQTVAVSDAGNVGAQSFAYEWGSPGDAANVQKELEARAAQLLAGTTPTATTTAAANAAKGSAAGHPNAASTASRTRTHGAHTATRKAAGAKTKDPASPLTEVHFNAFALTYGGGATLVLTARDAASTRSVAVIAIEDIYGKVQILWHSITDDTHLDVTPRMTLVDAVDPRGDGRANLLFEQRNATDRRFALYAVGATDAEQVFATDALPLHPVAKASE